MSHQLSASSQGPPAKSTQQGHKPRVRSISDLMEIDDMSLEKVFNDLETMEKMLEHDLSFYDLRPTVDNVSSVLQSLKQFKKHKAKPENKDVTMSAISFSNVEKKHVHNLGVNEFDPKLMAVAFGRISTNLKTIHPSYSKFWMKNSGPLVEKLKSIAKTTSMVMEAGSRMLIDQVIQEVIAFMTSLQMHTFLFPEMKLSIGTNKPAEIRFAEAGGRKRRYATFLTGTVDYLALGLVPENQNTSNKDDERKKAILKMKDLQSLFEPHGLLAALNQDFQDLFKILLVEAKREVEIETQRDDGRPMVALPMKGTQKPPPTVRDHMPQVIAESLATMAKTKATIVPWCLTTGHEWIFGLVEGDTDLEDTKGCHTLESIKIDFDANNVAETVEMIFTVLSYWILAKPDAISKLFQ